MCGGNFSGKKFSPCPFQKTFEQGGEEKVAGMFYRCGSAVQGLVRSTFGDPDLRSPSGFDSGLRPPLRMTREAGMGTQSLYFHRIYWIFGIVFKVRFYAGFSGVIFLALS